jgi:bifunctional non-homologous end joining protein LigD
MHWDFRLEINGVLASWAVPRGPSSDPKERRLAVRTEDHPVEYADFEGIIPQGNYGAGAVIVWDIGTFETVGDESAAEQLEHGKLDVLLHGHKLQGRWALVRMKGEGGTSWLLLHKGAAGAVGPELVVAQPHSVFSGLTVDELKDGVRRTNDLSDAARAAGAPRRRLDAAALRPMLARSADTPFSSPEWVFELKYDGVRVLAARAGERVALYYRTGRLTTAAFPEVAAAVAHLACDDFIVDGEVVALDERGASSFELLQQRLALSDPGSVARARRAIPIVMFCFDLLSVGGYDLRPLPLRTRKNLLERLVPRLGLLRFADHVDGAGEIFFEEITRLRLEGMVAKRAASVYRCGERSRDWLKVKARRSADLAVVGYTRGKGTREALGALMLAWGDGGNLVYAGNVGTGFDEEMLAQLRARLTARRRPRPAFRGTPPGASRSHVFVEPELVAEVRYAEVTQAGLLRQPVFVRVRDDKAVADCDQRPEVSAESKAGEAHAPPEPAAVAAPTAPEPAVRFTNVDKIFWPDDGYTKGDLLRYYETAWPWVAPYLRDRPVVLTRYPDGIAGKSFFQKNAPGFTPEWVQTVRIEDTDYFLCNDLQTLLYVINSGCIPLHVWSARRMSLQHPDWAILDLDPKGAPFADVLAVAKHIHRLLQGVGAPHFIKTSGQDGLHVMLPLGATLTHAEARAFAEVLARVVASEQAEIATVARPLGARGGKVYVDFLQNGFGKTIVAPFSVRPRRGAPVSMPLEWRELRRPFAPARFTISSAAGRVARVGDPMRAILETKVDVRATLDALSARVG